MKRAFSVRSKILDDSQEKLKSEKKRKIMAMALGNQDFDLEFFMKSTDVGLYNIAREIFSYLDPVDLNNFWAIGKKNKMIDEFLKKEKNFLYEKFEKVTLKVWKKKTG